jgi:hyaluronan synthase/N-acetylglucosaminyltransferase
MSSLAVQLLRHGMHLVFAFYAVVVMTHFALQVFFAHRAYRRALQVRARQGPLSRLPDLDVVITSYNEDPASLRSCLESLLGQDYRGVVHTYVVDDASANRAQLMPLYREFGRLPGWSVLLPERNRGKRLAQDAAFHHCRGELLVTIDSDTIVDHDGLSEIVRAFEDERVGAVTGDVGVTNRRTNLLTRLIDMRYWVAFNQERAAQGNFRTVLCCSGPLAGYRRAVLERVWDRYVNQTFRGIDCTYGDDRHLTNLVLGAGYDTLFLPFAHAVTNAPEDLPSYLRQQLRWNKSFYRELLWTLPFLLRRSLYMVFEVLVQTALPLLLTLAITTTLVYTVLEAPRRLLHYALVIAVMAILRCGYAIYRTRRPSFLLFVVYGFLHLALLVPLRIRALLTLSDNRWGTRTAVQPSRSVGS